MFISGGGATTLLHLAIRFPMITLALGLGGIATQVASSEPGTGERFGRTAQFRSVENRLLAQRPELKQQLSDLRKEFESLPEAAMPSEEAVKRVLSVTDRATDIHPKDVLANPDDRKEVGFLLFLDEFRARGSTTAARKLFVATSPPPAPVPKH